MACRLRLTQPAADAVRAFLLRKGKRLRPALFVLSYAAYAERRPRGLYTSAIGHLGIARTRGEFTNYTGTITCENGKPASVEAEVTIQANSVDTGWDARDRHIRGPDVFDVKQFPEIRFKWGLFGWTVLGFALLHLSANVANDYFDYRSGNDAANGDFIAAFTGGSRTVFDGRLSPQGLLALAMVSCLGAHRCPSRCNGDPIPCGPVSTGPRLRPYRTPSSRRRSVDVYRAGRIDAAAQRNQERRRAHSDAAAFFQKNRRLRQL